MIDSDIYKSLRNVPVSAMELAEVIGKRMKGKDYSFPSNKLADLERQGEIIRLKRGLYQYLDEDIRFDIDELKDFDTDIVRQCADCGRKSSAIENLIQIIERL